MLTYVTPSTNAFHRRKIFHSNERKQYETAKEWFHRIVEALDGCEFGGFNDFILIDKFIAGLDYETIQRYTVRATLTVHDVLSIGLDDTECSETVLSAYSQLSRIQESEDVLAGIEHKMEEEDADSQNELDNQISCTNNNQMVVLIDSTHDPCLAEKTKINVDKKLNFKNEQSMDQRLDEETVDTKAERNNLTESPKVEVKGFKRDKNNKIVCLDCGKQFSAKNSYNYHKRFHTGIDLLQCNICGKQFNRRSHLKGHEQTHINDNKALECYLCRSKFDRVHGLRIHFSNVHTLVIKRDLQCSMCGKAFSKQKDLDLHTKIHRGLISGHRCQHCEKVFDKRSALNEHLKSAHTITKEFVCEICGRACRSKNHLRIHAQIHNENRRFKCCECGHELKSATTLKVHMRQHTGERPYSCKECTKTFVTNPSLIKHRRVHRNEKPFPCKLCIKKFSTSYHLKIHMSTHTGARPYVCNQCDHAFTQLGTLKAHQRKMHSPANQT